MICISLTLGSADKQVIILNNSKVGVLKYNHSDPIQSISYNPVSGSILSCTVNDFGIWSNVQKTVTKFKVMFAMIRIYKKIN